jgi:hypothetical protein
MTMFKRPRPEDADARALDDYLDELNAGVLAPRGEIEPDIATVASQLQQVGIRTAEPAGLRTQLWEDLMSTAPSIETGSLAAPISRNLRKLRDVSAPLGVPRNVKRLRPRYMFELIAAAMLILGLVGAGLISQRGGGNDPEPTSALLAASAGSSPILYASPTGLCAKNQRDMFGGCLSTLDRIGGINFSTGELSESPAQNVEIQGWAITPGNTLNGVQANESTRGVVIDFVLDGAYSATYSVPVTVVHAWFGVGYYDYVDAGVTVELTRGDTVSYSLGGLVAVHNPLSVQRLEFKRAVIYDGNIDAFSTTSDGVTTRKEGDTTMYVDDSSSNGGLTASLYYIQNLYGTEGFPPVWASLTTIGPVDPQNGPEGADGFELVIEPTRG